MNNNALHTVTTNRPKKAKLIFNLESGNPNESPVQLVEILECLQAADIQPEVFLVHPKARLQRVAMNAAARNFDLVIVSGGDGTIDSVMGGLIGSQTTLGIIPTGTRNNIAASLGIPTGNISEAIRIIQEGRRIQMDVGLAQCGKLKRHFLEVASVGIVSALFPSSDRIQRGDLRSIGEFLSTLVNFQSGRIEVTDLAGELIYASEAHLALVLNMPLIAANIQLDEDIQFNDGLLDLFVFSDINKLQLLGLAVEAARSIPDDPRVHHLKVPGVVIRTFEPKLPMMADGFILGKGEIIIKILPQQLNVMSGERTIGEAGYEVPVEGSIETTDAD